MTKNELFAKYCNEYPLILGYREVSYEDWLQQQVIEYRAQVVDKNNTPIDATRDNEILISFSEYLHKRGILKVVEENIPIRVKLFLNKKR